MAGSRWGDPVPEAPPRPRKRKSRWGDAVPDPPAAAPGRQLVLPPGLAGTGSYPNRGALVLPGQYANQAELQRRLDEVNHRLNSNDFADRRQRDIQKMSLVLLTTTFRKIHFRGA